jgi:ribonuclease HI
MMIMPDYTIIFDGGSRGNGTANAQGYGSYNLTTASGKSFTTTAEYGQGVTNNEAEYKALIAALTDLVGRIGKAGKSPKGFTLEIKGDSALVINQAAGNWKCKGANLRPLLAEVRNLTSQFGEVTFIHHPREESVKVLGH